MPASDPSFVPLPEDPATLKALLLAALAERDREQQRAEAQEALAREKSALAAQQGKRADDLYVQKLRLQLELERYKKWYYGPRADRLQSSGELAQALLNFGEELEQKPVHPDDAAAGKAPASEGRRVKRRRGRRALANFENLPVTTQVYELQGKERACPCCGGERQEIGTEESWQIEYLPGHFERIQHVRKKYACGPCEASAEGPQIQVAARAESPIERGPGGAGAAGVHRDQQVFRLPAAVPAGRDFRAAGIRDCAGHAVGVVRGGGGSGRNPCTSAWPRGCGPRTWWPPTTPCCPC